MSYGVIVGRFQVADLTSAHRKLFADVQFNHDKVLVFVGEAPTINTDTNPIPARYVADMIKKEYGAFTVRTLMDHGNDLTWIAELERRIALEVKGEDVVLYGGRDSFLKVYNGKYQTEEIEEVPDVSATEERRQIGLGKCRNTVDFRKGLIYASQVRFPTVYSTVDMLIYDALEGVMLIGKKPGMATWCVPGGFVDVTDRSLTEAALRELSEEVPGLKIMSMEYIDSVKVNDRRYSRTKDKVMTHIFLASADSSQTCTAGDDLEEIKWVSIDEAEALLGTNHKTFIPILKNAI